MGRVDGNHMVQQFAAAAADPLLGDAVLPRTADRRPDGRHVHRANCAGHFGAILGIVVDKPNPNMRSSDSRMAIALLANLRSFTDFVVAGDLLLFAVKVGHLVLSSPT